MKATLDNYNRRIAVLGAIADDPKNKGIIRLLALEKKVKVQAEKIELLKRGMLSKTSEIKLG
tara:strand:- start:480 stop:665 length:186 start_codon:yes stop_codon:yes gene_type:complete